MKKRTHQSTTTTVPASKLERLDRTKAKAPQPSATAVAVSSAAAPSAKPHRNDIRSRQRTILQTLHTLCGGADTSVARRSSPSPADEHSSSPPPHLPRISANESSSRPRRTTPLPPQTRTDTPSQSRGHSGMVPPHRFAEERDQLAAEVEDLMMRDAALGGSRPTSTAPGINRSSMTSSREAGGQPPTTSTASGGAVRSQRRAAALAQYLRDVVIHHVSLGCSSDAASDEEGQEEDESDVGHERKEEGSNPSARSEKIVVQESSANSGESQADGVDQTHKEKSDEHTEFERPAEEDASSAKETAMDCEKPSETTAPPPPTDLQQASGHDSRRKRKNHNRTERGGAPSSSSLVLSGCGISSDDFLLIQNVLQACPRIHCLDLRHNDDSLFPSRVLPEELMPTQQSHRANNNNNNNKDETTAITNDEESHAATGAVAAAPCLPSSSESTAVASSSLAVQLAKRRKEQLNLGRSLLQLFQQCSFLQTILLEDDDDDEEGEEENKEEKEKEERPHPESETTEAHSAPVKSTTSTKREVKNEPHHTKLEESPPPRIAPLLTKEHRQALKQIIADRRAASDKQAAIAKRERAERREAERASRNEEQQRTLSHAEDAHRSGLRRQEADLRAQMATDQLTQRRLAAKLTAQRLRMRQHEAQVEDATKRESAARGALEQAADLELSILVTARCIMERSFAQQEEASQRHILREAERQSWVLARRAEKARWALEKAAREAHIAEETVERSVITSEEEKIASALFQSAEASAKAAEEATNARIERTQREEAARRRVEELARERAEREEAQRQKALREYAQKQQQARDRIDADSMTVRKSLRTVEGAIFTAITKSCAMLLSFVQGRDELKTVAQQYAELLEEAPEVTLEWTSERLQLPSLLPAGGAEHLSSKPTSPSTPSAPPLLPSVSLAPLVYVVEEQSDRRTHRHNGGLAAPLPLFVEAQQTAGGDWGGDGMEMSPEASPLLGGAAGHSSSPTTTTSSHFARPSISPQPQHSPSSIVGGVTVDVPQIATNAHPMNGQDPSTAPTTVQAAQGGGKIPPPSFFNVSLRDGWAVQLKQSQTEFRSKTTKFEALRVQNISKLSEELTKLRVALNQHRAEFCRWRWSLHLAHKLHVQQQQKAAQQQQQHQSGVQRQSAAASGGGSGGGGSSVLNDTFVVPEPLADPLDVQRLRMGGVADSALSLTAAEQSMTSAPPQQLQALPTTTGSGGGTATSPQRSAQASVVAAADELLADLFTVGPVRDTSLTVHHFFVDHIRDMFETGTCIPQKATMLGTSHTMGLVEMSESRGQFDPPTATGNVAMATLPKDPPAAQLKALKETMLRCSVCFHAEEELAHRSDQEGEGSGSNVPLAFCWKEDALQKVLQLSPSSASCGTGEEGAFPSTHFFEHPSSSDSKWTLSTALHRLGGGAATAAASSSSEKILRSSHEERVTLDTAELPLRMFCEYQHALARRHRAEAYHHEEHNNISGGKNEEASTMSPAQLEAEQAKRLQLMKASDAAVEYWHLVEQQLCDREEEARGEGTRRKSFRQHTAANSNREEEGGRLNVSSPSSSPTFPPLYLNVSPLGGHAFSNHDPFKTELTFEYDSRAGAGGVSGLSTPPQSSSANFLAVDSSQQSPPRLSVQGTPQGSPLHPPSTPLRSTTAGGTILAPIPAGLAELNEMVRDQINTLIAGAALMALPHAPAETEEMSWEREPHTATLLRPACWGYRVRVSVALDATAVRSVSSVYRVLELLGDTRFTIGGGDSPLTPQTPPSSPSLDHPLVSALVAAATAHATTHVHREVALHGTALIVPRCAPSVAAAPTRLITAHDALVDSHGGGGGGGSPTFSSSMSHRPSSLLAPSSSSDNNTLSPLPALFRNVSVHPTACAPLTLVQSGEEGDAKKSGDGLQSQAAHWQLLQPTSETSLLSMEVCLSVFHVPQLSADPLGSCHHRHDSSSAHSGSSTRHHPPPHHHHSHHNATAWTLHGEPQLGFWCDDNFWFLATDPSSYSSSSAGVGSMSGAAGTALVNAARRSSFQADHSHHHEGDAAAHQRPLGAIYTLMPSTELDASQRLRPTAVLELWSGHVVGTGQLPLMVTAASFLSGGSRKSLTGGGGGAAAAAARRLSNAVKQKSLASTPRGHGSGTHSDGKQQIVFRVVHASVTTSVLQELLHRFQCGWRSCTAEGGGLHRTNSSSKSTTPRPSVVAATAAKAVGAAQPSTTFRISVHLRPQAELIRKHLPQHAAPMLSTSPASSTAAGPLGSRATPRDQSQLDSANPSPRSAASSTYLPAQPSGSPADTGSNRMTGFLPVPLDKSSHRGWQVLAPRAYPPDAILATVLVEILHSGSSSSSYHGGGFSHTPTPRGSAPASVLAPSLAPPGSLIGHSNGGTTAFRLQPPAQPFSMHCSKALFEKYGAASQSILIEDPIGLCGLHTDNKVYPSSPAWHQFAVRFAELRDAYADVPLVLPTFPALSNNLIWTWTIQLRPPPSSQADEDPLMSHRYHPLMGGSATSLPPTPGGTLAAPVAPMTARKSFDAAAAAAKHTPPPGESLPPVEEEDGGWLQQQLLLPASLPIQLCPPHRPARHPHPHPSSEGAERDHHHDDDASFLTFHPVVDATKPPNTTAAAADAADPPPQADTAADVSLPPPPTWTIRLHIAALRALLPAPPVRAAAGHSSSNPPTARRSSTPPPAVAAVHGFLNSGTATPAEGSVNVGGATTTLEGVVEAAAPPSDQSSVVDDWIDVGTWTMPAPPKRKPPPPPDLHNVPLLSARGKIPLSAESQHGSPVAHNDTTTGGGAEPKEKEEGSSSCGKSPDDATVARPHQVVIELHTKPFASLPALLFPEQAAAEAAHRAPLPPPSGKKASSSSSSPTVADISVNAVGSVTPKWLLLFVAEAVLRCGALRMELTRPVLDSSSVGDERAKLATGRATTTTAPSATTSTAAMVPHPEPSASQSLEMANATTIAVSSAPTSPVVTTVFPVPGGSVVPLLPTSSISRGKGEGDDEEEDEEEEAGGSGFVTPALNDPHHLVETSGKRSKKRATITMVGESTTTASAWQTVWLTLSATLRAAEGPAAAASTATGAKKKGAAKGPTATELAAMMAPVTILPTSVLGVLTVPTTAN